MTGKHSFIHANILTDPKYFHTFKDFIFILAEDVEEMKKSNKISTQGIVI